MSTVLVFDSGIGGMSVLRAIQQELPGARFVYVADDAAFPYGDWQADALKDHIVALFGTLLEQHRPDIAVIACNTASTLVLPALRARFDIPFVGTVPAIKPAAEQTRSGLVSVLATPGTVKREYTFDLIKDFAPDVAITLVGSSRLATLCEAYIAGTPVDRDAVAEELAPCFVTKDGRRTDTVVLACTHYPLLLDLFQELAPWPVQWIDPAPAIARRVHHLWDEVTEGADGMGKDGDSTVSFTSGKHLPPALMAFFADHGLTPVRRG